VIARKQIEFGKTSKRILNHQLKILCLCELDKHKPLFDEEKLLFLDLRKQAKMQWLGMPN